MEKVYSFSGPTGFERGVKTNGLTIVQRNFIYLHLQELTDGREFRTGCALGTDTVCAVACLKLFPDARHVLYVPGEAHYNLPLVEELRRWPNVELYECPKGKDLSETMMIRNELMVTDSHLHAFPYEATEQRRSGTWATVRRGRRFGVSVTLHQLPA